MSVELVVAVVGWAAFGLILGAYLLLTARWVRADGEPYQVGAAGFVVNSGYNGAMPSAVLNVAWMGIAVFGL